MRLLPPLVTLLLGCLLTAQVDSLQAAAPNDVFDKYVRFFQRLQDTKDSTQPADHVAHDTEFVEVAAAPTPATKDSPSAQAVPTTSSSQAVINTSVPDHLKTHTELVGDINQAAKDQLAKYLEAAHAALADATAPSTKADDSGASAEAAPELAPRSAFDPPACAATRFGCCPDGRTPRPVSLAQANAKSNASQDGNSDESATEGSGAGAEAGANADAESDDGAVVDATAEGSNADAQPDSAGASAGGDQTQQQQAAEIAFLQKTLLERKSRAAAEQRRLNGPVFLQLRALLREADSSGTPGAPAAPNSENPMIEKLRAEGLIGQELPNGKPQENGPGGAATGATPPRRLRECPKIHGNPCGSIYGCCTDGLAGAVTPDFKSCAGVPHKEKAPTVSVKEQQLAEIARLEQLLAAKKQAAAALAALQEDDESLDAPKIHVVVHDKVGDLQLHAREVQGDKQTVTLDADPALTASLPERQAALQQLRDPGFVGRASLPLAEEQLQVVPPTGRK